MNYYIYFFPFIKAFSAINSFSLHILQIIALNVPGECRSGQAGVFVGGVYGLGDALMGDIPPGMMPSILQQEDC